MHTAWAPDLREKSSGHAYLSDQGQGTLEGKLGPRPERDYCTLEGQAAFVKNEKRTI